MRQIYGYIIIVLECVKITNEKKKKTHIFRYISVTFIFLNILKHKLKYTIVKFVQKEDFNFFLIQY
jgi:hypothetical protein